MIKFKIRKIWYSIKEYFEFLDRWFSYYKPLKKAYDFDYSCVIEVEKHQLIRLRNSLTKYRNIANWKLHVNQINRLLDLLDVYEQNSDCNILQRINKQWWFPRYVNTKNAKRFNYHFPELLERYKDDNYLEVIKSDIYGEKAWYLYHKYKWQYLRTWWD